MTTGETAPEAPARPADRLNHWFTLAANFGVLLGLFVLIIEVRQNAALTRAVMEQQKNDFLAEIEFNVAKPEIAEIWIKSVRHPEDLTEADIRIMDAILVALMLQWDHRFQMEAAGLVSREEARQHVLNSARYYFGSRFAKHWWSLQFPGWEGTPMMEVAGPIVEATDENFLADYYDSLSLAPAEPGTIEATKFTLLDLPREAVAPGIVRQYVTGVESTFSRWEVAAGGAVPMHSHYNEQVTLLLSGAAEVASGEERISLTAGDMLVLPPNVPHAYTFTEDSIVIEFFAPRRQDWIDAAGGRPDWAREP